MNKLQSIIKNNILKNILFSVFFVLGFNYYFYEKDTLINRSFFNLILLVLCIVLLNNNSKKINKKIPTILSFIFSFSLAVGKIIYKYNDITILFSIENFINSIIMIVGFTKIIGEIILLLFEKIKEYSKIEKPLWKIYNTKYIFLILWIVILISWIPAYLAYYPGILEYDARMQTMEATGFRPYSKYHPPIHTFIWQICLQICSNSTVNPLCIYSILQMIFMSFVFAKLIHLLIDRKVNNWIILFSILFFTLNPIIALFSFNMTKDVIFTGFMCLFILQIIKLLDSKKEYLNSKKRWLYFIIISSLMCLFRNNAIYVYVIFSVVLTIYLKSYWKELIVLLCIPIIIYIAINSVTYYILGICKGESREMLSVPMQQIAMVVKKHDAELDDNTKNTINKFLSYEYALKFYNPRFADIVKETFHSNYFDENKGEFIRLWITLFKTYPLDYLSSFLSLNLPYWYFDSNTLDDYSKVKYIEDGIDTTKLYPFKRQSIFPSLLEKYEKVASFEFVKDTPILVNLFSITTPLWICMFTIFVLIYKKQYEQILIVLPLLILLITYLAGPVSNFRYVFPIFSLYPILIVLIFNKNKGKVT